MPGGALWVVREQSCSLPGSCGAAGVWFGVGFSAELMSDLPYTIVVEGAPSQQQLEMADLVVDHRCQWCQGDVGTHLHRSWQCDGSRAFRMNFGMPPDVAEAADNEPETDCPREISEFVQSRIHTEEGSYSALSIAG